MLNNSPLGSLRLLHLPNDPSYDDLANRQNGPRDAFEGLHQEGVLSAYEAYLFLAEFRRSGNASEVRDAILQKAKAMRPDIIFWHHIVNFPVDQAFFDALRDASHNALLVYHEGDPFGRFFHRVPPNLQLILSNADIVFSIALGKLGKRLRAYGAKDLRYLPHAFDQRRFGKPWDFSSRRTYRLSMIANAGLTRIPGVYFSGGRKRIRLVRRLTKTFGSDFALYGRNWGKMWGRLASFRGPVAFDRQEEAIRDSWVSVNWDHYDDFAYYFSDRLPISLVTGVPHVTTNHLGYEDMFSTCPGLYTASTVDEILAKVDWVLSRPQRQLIDEGRAAQEWIRNTLDAEAVYRRSLEICVEKMAMRSAATD